MAKTNTGPEHSGCDKEHNNPCGFCRLTALQIADRFYNFIIRPAYTPRQLRKYKRIADRKMGSYDGEKPNT